MRSSFIGGCDIMLVTEILEHHVTFSDVISTNLMQVKHCFGQKTH
jgi:hypothetical protein